MIAAIQHLRRHDSLARRAEELSRAVHAGLPSPSAPHYQPPHVGLKYVDHCVGNVELGKMNDWVEFYADVMGFRNLLTFDDKTISTEYSSLMSKVMANGNDRIKFPINEPAQGKKKSQIDEYLDFYDGPGRAAHGARHRRHHRARSRRCATAASSSSSVPTTYYDELQERVGKIDEPIDALASWASWSTAIPTAICSRSSRKPVEDRPTVFYEIIQRKGAKSFGAGNFKALFEAIEREQALRGNL